MKIEFKIKDLVPQANLILAVGNLLTDCVKESKILESDIGRIIISDELNYANSINSLENNESYSSNNLFTEVGKTISQKLNGTIINNIVFHRAVFDACFYGFHTFPNINEWDAQTYIMYYVIHHEFAHCYDNIKRIDKENPKLTGKDNFFKINNVAKYYFNILIGEYSACYYSSYCAKESMMELEISNLNSYIVTLNADIALIKEKHKINSSELTNIAFSVAGLYWFILIQYSKLVAYKYGNNALNKFDMVDTIELNNESKKILLNLENILIQDWNNYPNINLELLDKYLRIWYQISMANNYLFKQGEFGDGIWWK